MKIAVVGTGAMGSVYAALLAEAGHEVWALDIWQEHLDAIRRHGLRIEGASGNRVVQGIRATGTAADVGACDLVVVATKASGVASAARSLTPLLGRETTVLTIQNGLGASDRIGEFLPSERVLVGIAGGFGASIKGPGHVHHNGMNIIRIGEPAGGKSERLAEIVGLWRGAGFRAKASEDIDQLVWDKFVCNVAFSAPCTVFGRRIGEMMADSHAWKISLGCGREAFEAGLAKGVNFSFEDPIAHITDFGKRMPEARPSMLLDHLAKRPSEIDAINGMVPIVAARVGTRALYNEVVTAIVKSREEAFRNAED